jgi:CRP-like cAMP-binding protein
MVSGRAKVASTRADGSCVPLAFRAPGEMLGESALAGAGRPRNATVTALCQGSTAFLPAERFRRLLAELELESALWNSVLMRQDEGDRIRMQQTSLPAERRLPAALLHLASVMGEPLPEPVSDGGAPAARGCLLRISLAQREIAGFAGMSRTSVHNAYTSLKEQGVIRTGRQYVAILDLAALEALAGENETV